MTRLTFALALALLAGGATAAGGYSARTVGGLCVGSKTGCFATLQAAVDAASNGDTITIAPGTFAGGVAVDVSVDIRGAGAGATIIRGGGPVVTIGVEGAAVEPTVSISGVTITGGVNNSVPDHAVTQGGGVQIPQGSFEARNGLGATATIRDSVISGNKVYSTQLLPPGFCGPNDCSFAGGGGISNLGTLTLVNTRVTDNQAGEPGSVTVVASSGGISSGRGLLTLRHSFVTGNRAIGTPPYGASASGGGINLFGAAVIDDTVVSGNSAELSSTIATNDFGPVAIAGGLDIQDNGSATVTHSIVRDNRVTASGTVADFVVGVAGGIDDDGSLVLSDSTVTRNETTASAPASGATALVGGAMDIDGLATIRDSRFLGNNGTGNAPAGTVIAGGGAIANFGRTTLERTVLTANSLVANGTAGSADGGAIWDGDPGDGRTPSLNVSDSTITANTLVGSGGVTLRGGGIFTTFPATLELTRTVVAGNRPDQCDGC
jgi:hypothetical protein